MEKVTTAKAVLDQNEQLNRKSWVRMSNCTTLYIDIYFSALYYSQTLKTITLPLSSLVRRQMYAWLLSLRQILISKHINAYIVLCLLH